MEVLIFVPAKSKDCEFATSPDDYVPIFPSKSMIKSGKDQIGKF